MSRDKVTFLDAVPLLIVHIGAACALFVGFSRAALVALLATYFLRVFALTGGYHRYFSHKAFKTSRAFQFILAVLGASAAQLGPLWWASHHRYHHQHADTELDVHSPTRRGFLWSHLGWLVCPRYSPTEVSRISDFAAYPELVWLNRYSYVPALGLATLLLGIGEWIQVRNPDGGVTGLQLVVWGFFVSTVLVYHVTFSINSLLHLVGRRRYDTPDTSRNNFVLALLTMGEGWHNNHHRFAVCARQGFRWWEIDLTYYVIRILAALRIVWDVREPPASVLAEARP